MYLPTPNDTAAPRMRVTSFLATATVLMSACSVIYVYHLLLSKRPTRRMASPAPAPCAPAPPAAPLACFVVTFKQPKIHDPLRAVAHVNTARMYAALAPHVVAYLAVAASSPDDSESVWLEAGNQYTITGVRTNEHGTPFFRSLIEQVDAYCPRGVPFVAYANADIMFNAGLVETLRSLRDWGQPRLMVVGRRSNHDLAGALAHTDIDSVSSTLFGDDAQDYFVVTRGLFGNWSELPDYVIGRRAYDNALVDWAFHNAHLVDATGSVTALHQTTGDGNSAGHSTVNQDKEYNVNLPGAVYDHGRTTHAHWYTTRCGESVCVKRRVSSRR